MLAPFRKFLKCPCVSEQASQPMFARSLLHRATRQVVSTVFSKWRPLYNRNASTLSTAADNAVPAVESILPFQFSKQCKSELNLESRAIFVCPDDITLSSTWSTCFTHRRRIFIPVSSLFRTTGTTTCYVSFATADTTGRHAVNQYSSKATSENEQAQAQETEKTD